MNEQTMVLRCVWMAELTTLQLLSQRAFGSICVCFCIVNVVVLYGMHLFLVTFFTLADFEI
jgi:hypothetical protein